MNVENPSPAQRVADEELPPIRTLTRTQRRVVGTLLEKSFTTPASYPLSLNALVNGCNQKSNRSPVTSFEDGTVLTALEELEELKLVGLVHGDSGYTEKFRHYMRQRFQFTEPQLAIITELLLRGRQALGELRTRASRMVPIDSLDKLRSELKGLVDQGYVVTSGSLEKRGIEITHTFYEEREKAKHALTPLDDDEPSASASTPAPQPAPPSDALLERISTLESDLENLRVQQRETWQELESVRSEFQDLMTKFQDLRTALGG